MATWDDARRRLGISERTVRRWVADGRLQAGKGCDVDDDSLEEVAADHLQSSAGLSQLAATFAETVRVLTAPQKLTYDVLEMLLRRSTERIDELERRLSASFDEREELASRAAEREQSRLDAEAARKLREVAADKVFGVVESLVDQWQQGKGLMAQLEPAKQWAASFSDEEWESLVKEAPEELRAALALIRSNKHGKDRSVGHHQASAEELDPGEGAGGTPTDPA